MRILPFVGGAVVLVMLLAAAVGMMGPETGDVDITMYYDDYLDVGGIESTSGTVEKAYYGGTEYLHAVGIGDGSARLSDGRTVTVTVEKADLDVWLITGQSNSGNYDYDAYTAEHTPLPGTAYYYGTDSRALCYPQYGISTYPTLTCGMYPMTSPATGYGVIGDKGLGFATQYYAHTGHKVYWICGGIGGRSVAMFSDVEAHGGTGEIYAYEHTLLDDAMGAVPADVFNVHIKDYIWIQGEADKDMAVDTYKALFTDWYSTITTSAYFSDMDNWPSGQHFGKCWISLIMPEWGNPVIAQRELAGEMPGVTIATDISKTFSIEGGTLNPGDGIHYTQKGDDLVSDGLAGAVNKAYRGEKVHRSAVPEGGSVFEGYEDLAEVLPLMVIIGLLVGAAGLIIIRRDD